MKKIEKFEDLEVWQEGMRMVIDIYKNLADCKDYSLRDQIQRAAVSIPSNISEGYDRQSNKEYVHFLYIARGSSAELRTQLYIALKLDFLTKIDAFELIDRTRKMSAMLFNLIKVRKEKFS
ncbi:MAG: four helix bundle protein [Candidatus Cloacimonadota bacterium]|nr:four helix bundle protein [Candidatus Cloacimonadota bacterium]